MALDAKEPIGRGQTPADVETPLPGYHAAILDTLQRRFLNTGGIIENHHGHPIRITQPPDGPIVVPSSISSDADMNTGSS